MDLFKDTRLTDRYKDLIKMSGGHARTLSSVKKQMTRPSSQNVDFDELIDAIAIEAKLVTSDLGKQLVGSAVCSARIVQDQTLIVRHTEMKVDAIRENGFCFYLKPVEDRRVILVLSPFQLFIFFINMDNRLGRMFQNSVVARDSQLSFGGQSFEGFHGAFECFQRMLWLVWDLSHATQVSIRSLYERAAVFSVVFKDQKLPLFDRYEPKRLNENFSSFFIADGQINGSSCLMAN